MNHKEQFKDAMNEAAAAVQKVMRVSAAAGLSPEAAALAGFIGVLSYARVDGLNEDVLLKEARKAVPMPAPGERVSFRRMS